jgi:predicted PurR-regulated permease PerM
VSRTTRKSHHSATPPPRFRHARQVFLAVTVAVIAFVVVVGHEVVLPFLFAALIGYVLFPAVRFVERSRMPRWLAILVVYALALGSMVGFAAVVVPRLVEEVKTLSTELPKLTARIRDDYLPIVDERLSRFAGHQAAPTPVERRPPIVLTPREDGSYTIELQDDLHIAPGGDGSYVVGPPRKSEDFSSAQVLRDGFDRAIAWAQKNSLELLAIGRAIVSGVSRGVFYFFITLMLAGYMMFTWESIRNFIREMWPRYRRSSFDRFLHRLDRGLAGVVRGQLLICLVNGVLSAIGFWFFELKYWPILALIAGVMSIIPIFGSILSTIPAVAIGLTQSFGIALSVLIWIVAIHQLEANFLNPKIIGDSAKIHPVLVVFALLFGEHFFQITGALLAVPALALVQAVFLHFRESILGLPEPATGVPSLRASPLPDIPPPDDELPELPPLAVPDVAPPSVVPGSRTASVDVVVDDRVTDLDASDEVETQLVLTRRSPSEIPGTTDPEPAGDERARKKRELTTTMKSEPK